MDQPTDILAGYLRETEMAKALGRTPRTLARWRELRIGPPFVRNGREPLYNVEAGRKWLAAGGTNGATHKRSKRR